MTIGAEDEIDDRTVMLADDQRLGLRTCQVPELVRIRPGCRWPAICRQD